MTVAQRVMLAAGFQRFRWYRRWVGGRWERRLHRGRTGNIRRWRQAPVTLFTIVMDQGRLGLHHIGTAASAQILSVMGDVEVWPTARLPVARVVR